MPCEMCGKDAPLKTAMIEGTEMRVCPDCQEYGHTVTKAPEATGRSKVAEAMKKRAKRSRPRDVYADHPEVLIEDYGTRIRKARTKAGFSVEELADEINEKKSVISRTETNDHHPSDALVTKLERKLGISLMEKPEPTQLATNTGKKQGGPVTLGDLLKDTMDDE